MHFRVMSIDDVFNAFELWRSCDGVGISDGDTQAGLTQFLNPNPDTSWVAGVLGRRRLAAS